MWAEAVDYVNRWLHAEVIRERERCALLCEAQGYHSLAGAIRRGEGPRVHEPQEVTGDTETES